MHEVDDIMLMTDEKEKMMNKKVAKKNYVFYAKRVLGEVLRLEANSTSCTLFMNQSNQKTLQNLKEKLNNMSEKIADWLIRQKLLPQTNVNCMHMQFIVCFRSYIP